MRRGSVLATAALLSLAAGAPAAGGPGEDEFFGPFPSWADVKRDYGAVGDGKADDTAAIQKALDDLRKESPPRPVLYIPAGTYRITRTLELLRSTHNESTGISIVGEHPDATVVRWDGPAGGVMFLYNPWYARMGRLTFDGAGGGGKAGTAIRHGERFTTFNELADLVIRDVGIGIEAGMKFGIAETAVLRCRFQRCTTAGIRIQDWNSLDWWVWHSLFEDCRVGVTNRPGCGHFHVYESIFRRSTEADMTMANTSYFGIRDNYSVGSRAFFDAGAIGASAETTLQRNTILDTRDAAAIRIGNIGPVLLLDNRIRGRRGADKGPAVVLGARTAAVSVGNTFTVAVADATRPGDRFRSMDDRTAAPEAIPADEPRLPATPGRAAGPAIEVAKGADAAAIQKAIDQAAGLAGHRPVVHLPAGKYRIAETIRVGRRCDVQIVGDGVLNATALEWSGKGEGPVFALEGPSRAGLHELHVSGGKSADAIVVAAADQPGGRVFGEQLKVTGTSVGLLVDGLARTDVVLCDFGHDSSGVGVKVIGGGGERPAGGSQGPSGGRVVILSGASSNNGLSYDVSRDGWLLVRDTWYESGNQPRFMRCTDSGTFTLHNGNIAHPHVAGQAGVEVDGFRGRLTFLGCIFTDVSQTPGRFPGLVVKGGPGAKVLALAVHGNGDYLEMSAPGGATVAGLMTCRYTAGGGGEPRADVGAWDDAFVREMLRQTRSVGPLTSFPPPASADASDVRFHRVIATGRNGVVIRAGG